MKNTTALFSILLMALLTYYTFDSLKPGYSYNPDTAPELFSVDRALKVVKTMSESPHAVGFPAHREVRDYILDELEAMGLNPEIQYGQILGDWGNFSRAENVLARIRGTGEGKALLLLSHYDSSPHSSLGASDAASGVATILEGIRALKAGGKRFKNDIIILITDAEELGLNGAEIFVRHHPWAADVGLVLNFEARGSGGPSYMLLETNAGNKKLIEGFTEAGPAYPVGNSLAYSIYKMLPNDTDLTVFREDGDIEGFNFAFIDDHYDYHSVLDNYERLDRESLAHQGAYLMPLLNYYVQADLNNLKDNDDLVYFNVPFFKLVSYPFSYIWPMLILGWLFFSILLVHGIRLGELNLKAILKGGLAALIVLGLNAILGYFAWPLLVKFYPAYADILHGFPYNGHDYIAAFVLISSSLAFLVYSRCQSIRVGNLMVFPILIWLILCTLVAFYLPGAAFFILPVYGLLAAFMVSINQEKPKVLLLVALAVPAIWILTPMVQMFPVGLGLKILVVVTVLTSLIFFMLLPILGRTPLNAKLGFVAMVGGLYFLISAHMDSGFNNTRPKPSSLVYLYDSDNGKAQWATYDKELSPWNAPYFENETVEAPSKAELNSKYQSAYSRVAAAPGIDLAEPLVRIDRDTVLNNTRRIQITIIPQREINRLGIYTDYHDFKLIKVNGAQASDKFYNRGNKGTKLTHYVTDNDATQLILELDPNRAFTLNLYESSNNLRSFDRLKVKERSENEIPMPFVVNDAVIVKKQLSFE